MNRILYGEEALKMIEQIGVNALTLKVLDGNIVVEVPHSTEEYVEFKELLDLHESTDVFQMKTKIKSLLKQSDMSIDNLENILGTGRNTAYAIMNPSNKSKVNIVNLMLLSKYLSIDILEFYESVEEE